MPNYRYNSPDYMRRRNRGQNPTCMSPAHQDTVCPVCRDTGAYDELNGLPIAMAYVPWQKWQNIYEPDKALCQGTIFEDLAKPFHGTGGCQNVR